MDEAYLDTSGGPEDARASHLVDHIHENNTPTVYMVPKWYRVHEPFGKHHHWMHVVGE